jgi:GNAT superfamily N-acetyltransferase
MPDQPDSEVIVRAATAADAEAIHAMILLLARDTATGRPVSSTPDDFRRFGFSAAPCFQALLAERRGAPVGLCLYFFSFSSWMGKRGVYVQDLFVDDSERGTGLGRKLIAETARRAGEQGAGFMRLSVDRKNLGAQSFYSKIGMERAEYEVIFKAVDAGFEALKQLD